MYNALKASHRKLVTELQSSLECPVCLDTIRTAPVQCCRNGHLICSVCIRRSHICPTCRAPMTVQSGLRCVSHSANRLVDLLPHPCTHKDRGCQEEQLLPGLARHEPECRYRSVRCPVGYCLQTLTLAGLSEHVSGRPHALQTRAHPVTGPLVISRALPAQDGGSLASFQLRSFDPIRFTLRGSLFYLQTIASQCRRFLYNFVQLEGSRAECGEWWARVRVASWAPGLASQVCQTVRPSSLDQHCRDDLESIGEKIVVTHG